MEDRKLREIAQRTGYSWGFIKGIVGQPKTKYYSMNADGEVTEHTLPADPYSLQHYLAKGFTLKKEDLKPQAKEGEFVCAVCGKAFSAKIALLGHQRTHKKIILKEG